MTALTAAPPRPHLTAARTAERLIFVVLLFALGARAALPRSEELVLGLCIIAAPMWARPLVATRWGKAITTMFVATLVAGGVLSVVSGADHQVSRSSAVATACTVALVLAAAGVVVRSIQLLSVRVAGVSLGLGMLMGGVLVPGQLGAENPLKFAVLVPLSVIIFSLVYGAGALWQLAALLVMAAVGIVADARAFFGTALVAAVIVLWQFLRGRRPTRSWALTAVFLVGMGVAIYSLATSLLIDGYLGSDAQERSVQQVQTSGSILLGGRPELSATAALIGHDATGFGFGVVANDREIEVAKDGMAALNYDPNNGYVDTFMFGSAVELHSVAGDLWAAAGVVGLILVATLLVFTFTGLARLVAARRNDAILVFVCVWTLWNLLFSPFGSAATILFLTIGLLLAVKPATAGSE